MKKNATDEFIDDYILSPAINTVQNLSLFVGGCFGLVERELALFLYNVRFGFPGHNLMPDVPRFLSNVVGNTALVVGAVGSMYFGANVAAFSLCKRECKTCNGWNALRCTMCRGSGTVPFHLRNFNLKAGEVATSSTIAAAIVDGRADVDHLPAGCGFESALPTTECPTCNGSGVMTCPKCGFKFRLRFSYERAFDVPWNTWNVVRKCDTPSEHLLEGIESPDIAAFKLLARPELEGEFQYDEDVRQKIWWKYKDYMRYKAVQNLVSTREAGWEYMQKLLFALNPVIAREDPVVEHNVPYIKARKKLEAEVMALEPPPRPASWVPAQWKNLNFAMAESRTGEELENEKETLKLSSTYSGQKEAIEFLLDKAWEDYWRKQKLDELVAEKIQPYLGMLKEGVSHNKHSKELPFALQQEQKKVVKSKRRFTWFTRTPK